MTIRDCVHSGVIYTKTGTTGSLTGIW